MSSVGKGKILGRGLEQGIPKNTLHSVLRHVQEHSLLSPAQTAVTELRRRMSVFQKSVVLQEEAGGLKTRLESCHKTTSVYFLFLKYSQKRPCLCLFSWGGRMPCTQAVLLAFPLTDFSSINPSQLKLWLGNPPSSLNATLNLNSNRSISLEE